MTRIGERFDIMDAMTQAVVEGVVRSMIVVGPPGVGKSYGVEFQLEKAGMFDKLAGKRVKYEVIKGAMTSIGLYCTLYKYSDPKNVLVFDDCDSILLDDVSLNLLKGALDSGKKRKISWLSESSTLRREGIPDQFEFKGSVIFITNLKFDTMKSQKLRDHLDALESRCHYIDLQMDTEREKILRIEQVVRQGDMLEDYDFKPWDTDEVLDFIKSNASKLRELSLRMVIKIADLKKGMPQNWQAVARTTCMRRV